jgi:hypothetical protein
VSRCRRCDSVGCFLGSMRTGPGRNGWGFFRALCYAWPDFLRLPQSRNNCVAIWVGNSRLPNLLHDCYKKAGSNCCKIYIRVLLIYPGERRMKHVRTRRQLLRVTTVSAASIPFLALAIKSASEPEPEPEQQPPTLLLFEGYKDFDSFGRSSSAGPANWR